MGALSSLLEKEAEENSLMHYLATVGWSIGKAYYKQNYLPTFTEMKKGAAARDNRSGAEIVDDLKNKLRKRKDGKEA